MSHFVIPLLDKPETSQDSGPGATDAPEPSTSREQEPRPQYHQPAPTHEGEGIPRHHRRITGALFSSTNLMSYMITPLNHLKRDPLEIQHPKFENSRLVPKDQTMLK